MHTIRLTPLEEDTGTRLDSFLSRRVEGLTRSAAARLLAEGCVTCDGAVPGKSYRIDRDTSGLIIAAKNDAAHLALAAQLADHTLARTYECLAVGNFRQDSGTVNAPIGRSRSDRKKMAVVAGGRPAVTHWEVLARYPGVTHLRCRLETGRTHQIRVHLAYIGHPILGDTVYGNKKPVPGLTGQCLHATGLRFLHPHTGCPVELTCPRPEEFERMLVKLQKRT